MVPPDHYDVVDVKNPHMKAGTVIDRGKAREQWDELKRTFLSIGLIVEEVPPTPGCEDMVFARNQCFFGPPVGAVMANMRHESRQREVPAFEEWLRAHGFDVVHAALKFEGGGDAIWHPDGSCIWMGHGFRSEPGALAGRFAKEIIELELVDERFYHLDTCFCPLDTSTVLIHPPAFADTSRVREHFQRVLEVDPDEAATALACNASAFFGTDVVIDCRATKTIAQLHDLGYRVHPVDTGEFLKSGGSVYCLHNYYPA